MKIYFYQGDNKVLLSEADEQQRSSNLGVIAQQIERTICKRPFTRNIFSFPQLSTTVRQSGIGIEIEVYVAEHDGCLPISKSFGVSDPFQTDDRFKHDPFAMDKWKSVLCHLFYMGIQ